MKNLGIIYALMNMLLILALSSCKKNEEAVLPEGPTVIGPIIVDQIEFDYWQDLNHVQGICFSDQSMFISCSRQLIKYDLVLKQVTDERLCSNLTGGDYCTHYHHGDLTSNDQDIWVTYHEGSWQAEYFCYKNQILKFENGIINETANEKVYNLDYPGHVGSIEIINDIAYVAGVYITPDWTLAEDCNPILLVYQYDLNTLQDTAIASCNTHSGEIFINHQGRNGIQVLSKRDDNNLLVVPYACDGDDSNYVYNIDLSDGLNTVTLFQEENWAYGVAFDAEQKIFYSEDNRETNQFSIFEFVE